MVEDDMEGKRPIYRPKGWNVVERKKEKIREKHNWSNRGGHIAPIFVPPTSNGKLARELRYIAESEAGVLFKVVETGGRTIKSHVQKSDPTSTVGVLMLTALHAGLAGAMAAIAEVAVSTIKLPANSVQLMGGANILEKAQGTCLQEEKNMRVCIEMERVILL